jgi:2-hydroxychromene-2-carboxylate isomerase
VARELQWRPFWEPDAGMRERLAGAGATFPYVDMSRPKALYILQDVRRLATQRGLAVRWPVDRCPRWEVSHLAYLLARRHGAGEHFIEAAYRARWQCGLDISDPSVIATLGGKLGLDADDCAAAADDPELRDEGLLALLDVVRDGAFGVPFFLFGREKFWGVDRLADFAELVRSRDSRGAPPSTQAATLLAGPAADQGHAGGCG